MSEAISGLPAQAQQALSETVVQPLVFATGQVALLEDAFEAAGWCVLGLLLAVLGPCRGRAGARWSR